MLDSVYSNLMWLFYCHINNIREHTENKYMILIIKHSELFHGSVNFQNCCPETSHHYLHHATIYSAQLIVDKITEQLVNWIADSISRVYLSE